MTDTLPFGLDIDFLPVGDGCHSGDAICLRWGFGLKNPDVSSRQQFVMVVDGGFSANGDDIVDHIKKFYGTTHVNVVVNTHPHADHVNGLLTVLEKCKVDYLVMHCPWEHSGLKGLFEDGRVTSASIKNHLKEGLEQAYTLCEYAKKNKITVCEGFAPSEWGPLCGISVHILHPTLENYEKLLPSFNATPTDGDMDIGARVQISNKLVPHSKCQLTNRGSTSPENNSGIVLCLRLPSPKDKYVLLTGDAGIPALEAAVTEASRLGIDLSKKMMFFQVPHHGSIQNLGPSVLSKLFGDDSSAVAYISVSKVHDNEHPSKHVTNALLGFGIKSYTTEGKIIHKGFGEVPIRPGWVSLSAVPFYEEVESLV